MLVDFRSSTVGVVFCVVLLVVLSLFWVGGLAGLLGL